MHHLGIIYWTKLWDQFYVYITVAFLLSAIVIAGIVILENRSPFKTISWILIILFLPIAGIIIYLFFGQNYRKQKIFSRKGLQMFEFIKESAALQDIEMKEFPFKRNKRIWRKKNILRLLLRNSYALITSNNQVKILNDGRETFGAMLPALRKAKHHIHMEFYIIDDDKIGNEVREILISKAKAGVKVRLIYDDVGSWALGKKFIRSLKDAGVEVHCFMRVRFPLLTSKVNFRNHRKITVVDGKVGYIGGLNIADRYIEGVPGIGPWRDTHLELRGSAVNCLQMVFLADWFFVGKERLNIEDFSFKLDEGEGKVVQIVVSGPDSDWESIGQAYFSAIASARKQVYIATPYFMPTPDILTAIKTSALSGIDVRLLIPQKSDTVIPKLCTESYIEELLEAGVRVYLFKNGFYHSKLVMVDGVWSSVGSANMDFRSLETNFESNAIVYDEQINQQLVDKFKSDLKQAVEVDLEEWRRRPGLKKLKSSVARLASPLM
ncbi:cardiolipin synthase [Puteibacter caeruleilacunae]|nr:cardiolipin synthase [Puteibacter caeruleilacunae]